MGQVLQQGRQAPGETFQGVSAVQRTVQDGEAAFQQLLVEFNEMHFTGTSEQDAGKQRDHGGAPGKQQRQAAAQGQAAHQLLRSSST